MLYFIVVSLLIEDSIRFVVNNYFEGIRLEIVILRRLINCEKDKSFGLFVSDGNKMLKGNCLRRFVRVDEFLMKDVNVLFFIGEFFF